MSSKRQKTTHTLPATHNGSIVTVTINDSRYDQTTVVEVSVAGQGITQTATGSVTLTATETQVYSGVAPATDAEQQR